MEKTLKQYKKVTQVCIDLYKKKLKDYGCAWRILRLPSLTDQIFIKAKRLRSIQDKKAQKVVDETHLEFIGIINYSIMSLIQIEKGVVNKPDLSFDEAVISFENQIKKSTKLMVDKNHDYGEAWRDMRISSLTDLIIQKLLRIKQIEDNDGKTLASEGIDANYLDIINYAIFALILEKN